jgi:5-methylcytosine-specific restriction endonuclease McrA
MARGNKYQIPYICVHGIDPVKKCTPCQSAYNMAWQKADRLANPEKYKEKDIERRKNWYTTNKAKQIIAYHNSRAKKAGAQGIITAELYQQIVSAPCVYCGYDKFIELDHKIAVTRGGSNEPENLQPVCKYCNRSKYAYDEANFLEWLQRLRQVVTD